MAENLKGITIQFKGDSTKFEDSAKGVNNALKLLKSEAKQFNTALKFNSSDVDALKGKLQNLQQQEKVLVQKTQDLKRQLDNLSPSDIGGAEWTKLQNQLNNTENDLAKVRGESQKTEKAIKEISNEKIDVNTAQAESKLSKLSAKMKTVGEGFSSAGEKISSAGEKISVASGVATAGLGMAVKGASDTNESLNKVSVAFGKSAKEVENFANTSLEQFGVSRQAALDMTATFGDMGTSMGLSQQEAAKMSTELAGLSGDLSSFKNIGIDQASQALTGIFTGETESLKSLGIVMTDTNVEAYALANGFNGTWQEASQSEKVMWRYKYVMSQTKNAQGDFARTNDSFANQMRMLKGRFQELGADIGQILLPALESLLGKVNKALSSFKGMDDSTKKIITTIGLVVAGAGPLLILIGKLSTGIGALMQAGSFLAGTVLPALGISFTGLSAPILAVVGIVGVITSAFALVYANCEQFRNAVNNLASVISTVVMGVLQFFGDQLKAFLTPIIKALVDVWNNSLKPAFVTVANYINSTVVPTIRTLWSWFEKNLAPIFHKVASILGSVLGVAFKVFGSIMGTTISVVTNLFNWFGNLWNQFSKTKFAKEISNCFKDIGKWINKVLDDVQDFINGFSNMVSSVSGFVSKIVNSVSDGMGKVGNALKEVSKYNPFDAGGFGGNFGYVFDAGGFGGGGDINLTANLNITNNGNAVSKTNAQVFANDFVDIVNKELGRRLKMR